MSKITNKNLILKAIESYKSIYNEYCTNCRNIDSKLCLFHCKTKDDKGNIILSKFDSALQNSSTYVKDILNTYNISYAELKKYHHARMINHIIKVKKYYKLITGKELETHDQDKLEDKDDIWKVFYYYKHRNKDKYPKVCTIEYEKYMPEKFLVEWYDADCKHRETSTHHIESLNNPYTKSKFDWDELVADFFAVMDNRKYSKFKMLWSTFFNYRYAWEYIWKNRKYYKMIK